MQTARHNVFALTNSGLEAFLYPDVGTESNGSALTVLSMLARLGRDPWAEAARWATLSEAGAIEDVAQSIAQMPLVRSMPVETRATAARLVHLLPVTTPGAAQGGAAKVEALPVPGWLPITILYFAVSLGMAVSALMAPKPSQAIAAPTEQHIAPPGTIGAGTVPLVDGKPSAGPVTIPSGPRAR